MYVFERLLVSPNDYLVMFDTKFKEEVLHSLDSHAEQELVGEKDQQDAQSVNYKVHLEHLYEFHHWVLEILT